MSIIRTPAAFSVSGDVLDYSLHDNDRPSFFARVEKVRLREISLVLAPVDRSVRFCGASCRHRCSRSAPPSNRPIIVEGILNILAFTASSLRLALSIHHMPQIRQYQPEFLIAQVYFGKVGHSLLRPNPN
jgi:hypothetical protein